MAQLSDDCFAFGGPMMSVDEAVAIIAARVTAVQEVESVSLDAGRWADSRARHSGAAAAAAVHQFRRRWLCGAGPRPSARRSAGVSRSPVASRPARRRAKRSQPGQAVRIFTGAPMPDGADTVFMQEDVRIDDAGRVVLPAGLKPGANVRPAGEDIALGHAALKNGQPAAAAGCRARRRLRPDPCRCDAGACASRCSPPATNWFRRAARARLRNCSIPTASCWRRCWRGSAARSAISASSADDRAAMADGLKKVAGAHDLILTTGGVSTGEEDHVKASVESAGSLVLWRMAIKPGRPVAMGIIGGTPFIGLPGNPVASFVTFVHVVRPTVLALMGATPAAIAADAGPVGLCLQEENRPPRICPGELAQGRRRRARGDKISARGRRDCCRRWSIPTGWSNSARRSPSVEPGQIVGFLSYASLM